MFNNLHFDKDGLIPCVVQDVETSEDNSLPITIGMPAGSLEQGAEELMERAGLPIKWQGYRGFVDDPRIKSVFQLRPQDSPLYVARGNLDIAFTGQDCVKERDLERQVIEIAQLPFARAGNNTVQFILFVREDSEVHDLSDIRKGMRIVTECPTHIIRQYLQKYGIEEVEIDICHGRTEAIVNAGFADIGIDRAETGKTLLENQLRPVTTIDESVTILIANPQSWTDAQKRKTIDEIRTLLLGVIIAKDKVVLEMNVPAERLEQIVKILPALRSPTISELYGGDWFAVKSVVEKRKVNLLIPKLKALGAEGIIEGPLNKIIP